MKVLVTGRDGQLAQSLNERGSDHPQLELLFAARPDTDLSIPGSVAAAIAAARPDVVINAAAYTDVDRAEDEPELAHRINADGAGEAARAAADIGAPIIQLSTDYVFDGKKTEPYVEADPTNPLERLWRVQASGRGARPVRQRPAPDPAHLLGREPVRAQLRQDHDRCRPLA